MQVDPEKISKDHASRSLTIRAEIVKALPQLCINEVGVKLDRLQNMLATDCMQNIIMT